MGGTEQRSANVRQAWRPSGATVGLSPEARLISRWLLVFLLLALLALLAWALLPTTVSTSAFLISVWFDNHERLTLPPIPFAVKDANGIEQALDEKSHAAPKWILAAGDRPSRLTLDTLPEETERNSIWTWRGRKAVIVWISAQGISVDGQPYLLDDAFYEQFQSDEFYEQFQSKDEKFDRKLGRVRLEKICSQIAKTRADLKLLILDFGNVNSDPYLGMLFNEFPALVQDVLNQAHDPALCILLSHSLFETPYYDYGEERSAFGLAVADALGGAADGVTEMDKKDGRITLRELERYVTARFNQWFENESFRQTPSLLFPSGASPNRANAAGNRDELLRQVILELKPASRKAAEKDAASGKKEGGEPSPKDEVPKKQPKSVTGSRAAERVKEAVDPRPQLRSSIPSGLQLWSPTAFAASPADTTAPAAAPPAAAPTQPPPAAAPPAPASSQPPPAKAAEPAAANAGAVATSPAAGDPGKAAPKSGAAAEATPKEDSNAKAIEEITKAWRLRDQLKQRETGWSPVDFAPHHWRVLNALLLDHERKLLGGRAFGEGPASRPGSGESKDANEELSEMVRDMGDLMQVLKNNSVPPKDLRAGRNEVQRIAIAWYEFRDTDEYKRLTQGTKYLSVEWNEAKETVRLFRDIQFDLPDLVRAFTNGPGGPDPKKLEDLISACCGAQKTLAKYAGQSKRPSLDETIAGELASIRENLNKHREAVLKELNDKSNNNKCHVGDLWRNSPLDTSLLTADKRKPLLDARGSRRKSPDAASGNEDAADANLNRAGTTAIAKAWPAKFLAASLHLHLEASAFFRDDVGDVEESSEEYFQRLSKPENKAEFWEKVRKLGLAIGKREQQLGTLARSDSQPSSLVLLRMDARAVHGMENVLESVHGFLDLPFNRPDRPNQIDVAASDSEGPLQERNLQLNRKPVPIAVTVESGSPRVTASVNYDDALIEIRDASGKPLLPKKEISLDAPDEKSSPDAGDANKWTLKYQLVARASSGGIEDIEFEFRQDDGVRKPLSLKCDLPLPNDIDLVVDHVDASAFSQFDEHYPIGDHGLANPRRERAHIVRPFANRSTAFRLQLSNRSGRPKQVTVKLFQVPLPSGTGDSYGRIVERKSPHNIKQSVRDSVISESYSIRPEVKCIAETAPETPVSLPDGNSVDLNFRVPGAAKAPVVPAPAKPAPAPEIDIGQGLLCVVTNVKDPEQQWLHWLQFEPLDPRKYIDFVPKYDRSAKSLTLSVALKDLNRDRQLDVPPGTDSQPVSVECVVTSSCLDDAGPPAEGKWTGKLTPKDPMDQITSIFNQKSGNPASAESAWVWLSLDGWPRAAAFQGFVDGRKDFDDKRSELAVVRLRLESVDKDGKTSPLTRLNRDADGPALWGIRFADKKLGTKVQMTVRADAFGDQSFLAEANDSIEVTRQDVGSTEPLTRLTARSDRKIDMRLVEITDSLIVNCKVADFSQHISVSGRDREIEFTAELKLGTEGKPEYSHTRDTARLLVDNSPPQLEELVCLPNSQLAIGSKFQVNVKANDSKGAGVEKVSFALVPDTDGNGKLDKKEAEQAVARGDGVQGSQGSWGAEFDTASITELMPGKYLVLATAADRLVNETAAFGDEAVVTRLELKKKDESGTRKPSFTFGPGETRNEKSPPKPVPPPPSP